jgi:hypothetical protein
VKFWDQRRPPAFWIRKYLMRQRRVSLDVLDFSLLIIDQYPNKNNNKTKHRIWPSMMPHPSACMYIPFDLEPTRLRRPNSRRHAFVPHPAVCCLHLLSIYPCVHSLCQNTSIWYYTSENTPYVTVLSLKSTYGRKSLHLLYVQGAEC